MITLRLIDFYTCNLLFIAKVNRVPRYNECEHFHLIALRRFYIAFRGTHV